MACQPSLVEIETRIHDVLPKYVEWAKTEFHLKDFDVKVRFNKRVNGRSLAYGHGVISLAVNDILKKPLLGFREYPSYENDYEIGSFETNDWKLWLDATLIHELSHLVQFNLGFMDSYHPLRSARNFKYFDGLGEVEYGHGEFFRSIYSSMRRRFINKRVPRNARGMLPSMFEFGDEPSVIPVPSLSGKTFKFDKEEYEILGIDETNILKRDRYLVKCKSTKTLYDIDISTIYKKSVSLRRVIENDFSLMKEKRRWDNHDLRVTKKVID